MLATKALQLNFKHTVCRKMTKAHHYKGRELDFAGQAAVSLRSPFRLFFLYRFILFLMCKQL